MHAQPSILSDRDSLPAPALRPRLAELRREIEAQSSKFVWDQSQARHASSELVCPDPGDGETDEAFAALGAALDAAFEWKPADWSELGSKIELLGHPAFCGFEQPALEALVADAVALRRSTSPLASKLREGRQLRKEAEAMDYTDDGDTWLGEATQDASDRLLMQIHRAPCRSVADAAIKLTSVEDDFRFIGAPGLEQAIIRSIASVKSHLKRLAPALGSVA